MLKREKRRFDLRGKMLIFSAVNSYMTTITTTRHKIHFYLPVIFGTLFFIGLGIVLIQIYFQEREWGNPSAKITLMPFFSVAVFAIAIYTLYKYFKNAPIIELCPDFISFNSRTYAIDELEQIQLTGKQNFPYIGSFPMEAATLIFKNGDIQYIFDSMYSNSWQLKSFLKQVVIEKKRFSENESPTIQKLELQHEWYDTFKDNQFTSFRGITLWGFIGFVAYMHIAKNNISNEKAWLAFFLLSSFLFSFNSWLMHYFKVSDKYFVVKNHNFFWKTKAYLLSDIDEVVFETQGKMPNCLRVITKNFKSKMYPAGTLRNKTWLQLKDKLERYHIKVRNECIF